MPPRKTAAQMPPRPTRGVRRKTPDRYTDGNNWEEFKEFKAALARGDQRYADYLASGGADKGSARAYRLTKASDIGMMPTYWQWKEGEACRIPVGELILTVGHGDVGKSTFNIWRHARLTCGELPGHFYGTPRNCIIAASEDSWKRTLNPRLHAAGADMDRIFRLDIKNEKMDGVELSLPSDFNILEEAIKEVNAVDVYFDALMSTVDTALDAHKGRDARVALQPLGHIAERTGCSVVGNCHFNKASGSDPTMRILNSVEVRNVARAVIYFAKDEDGTSVLSRAKGNLGVDWPPMEYRIEDATFTLRRQEYHPGRFVLGGESAMSASDILRAEGKGGGRSSAISECRIWLAGWMGLQGNKAMADAAIAAGAEEGFNEKMVKKARADIGLRSERTGGVGAEGGWKWFKSEDGKWEIPSPKRR